MLVNMQFIFYYNYLFASWSLIVNDVKLIMFYDFSSSFNVILPMNFPCRCLLRALDKAHFYAESRN